MVRPTTSAMDTALVDPTAEPGLLIEIGGPTPERIVTRPYDLIWDSRTWFGLGRVESVAVLRISSDSLQHELRLVLGVVDNTRLTYLANDIRGQFFELWAAMFTSGAVVIDPLMMFYGRMYPGPMADKRMEVIVESRFNFPRNAAVLTYSDSSQRAIDATDRCFFDVTNKTARVLGRPDYVQKGGLRN